jgi:hypothetical protein
MRRHLLNHLIRAQQQRCRNCDTQRLRSLEVDRKYVICRLFDREVSRLGASEDLVDIHGGVPVCLDNIHAVGEKPTGFDELFRAAYGGKPVLNGEPGDLAIMNGTVYMTSPKTINLDRGKPEVLAEAKSIERSIAAGDEREITHEMIDAGVLALLGFDSEDSLERRVEAVLRAGLSASGVSRHSTY